MYLAAKEIPKTNLLTNWEGKDGKFVRTFGMNSKRNKNEWRATWDSIKKYIHTAIGRPGIEYELCKEDGCSLDHVDADTFEDTIQKQKPYERTKIIDYVLDDKNESVDLIHEVTDDEFWKKLESREIKYGSPLIWPLSDGIEVLGKGRNDLPIIDTDAWKYTHHAFLTKDPAFGDDIATVKTMCEGENCDVKLLSAQTLPITTLLEKKEYLQGEELPMCGNCKFFVEDESCSLVKGVIKYEDICDLHIFGPTQPKGTKVTPDFEKKRVNYRHAEKSLEAETTIANQENISHLQEIPLLYKHKGQLILLSASSCVQEIIKKKKEDGIVIDDQALAIAYSECGESKKAKSSFKTCSCIANQKKMEHEELEKENKDLKAKLKAIEDKDEIEKSRESHKGRYAKLFANVEEDEREKMIARMKAGEHEDKDELKAMEEVHEEMKSKKGAEHKDEEKEEMKARLEGLEEEKKEEKMKAMVSLQAKYGLSKKEQNQYHASLKAKSYSEVMSKYEDVESIIKSMKASTITNKEDNFDWNGGDVSSLKGKTFEQIAEVSQ